MIVKVDNRNVSGHDHIPSVDSLYKNKWRTTSSMIGDLSFMGRITHREIFRSPSGNIFANGLPNDHVS